MMNTHEIKTYCIMHAQSHSDDLHKVDAHLDINGATAVLGLACEYNCIVVQCGPLYIHASRSADLLVHP
jgi:hypothetical protein